jgi:hypothetical protein
VYPVGAPGSPRPRPGRTRSSCGGTGTGSPERKLHRVGPDCETWLNTLTGNPYSTPKVGPQFGLTLYNFRSVPPTKRMRWRRYGPISPTAVLRRRIWRGY